MAGGLATDPSAYHVFEGRWLGGRSGGTISRGSAAESILGREEKCRGNEREREAWGGCGRGDGLPFA